MHHRDVVQLPKFAQYFEMYRRNYPEMDEVYRDSVAVLLDKPSTGNLIGIASDLRLYMTLPTDQTPAFWITYDYDIDNLYLYAITKVSF